MDHVVKGHIVVGEVEGRPGDFSKEEKQDVDEVMR